MTRYLQRFDSIYRNGKLWELGLSLFLGLMLGVLVVFYPYLPLPSNFQKLVLVLPFAISLVILFNNLEKLILFTIAISIPLNLDFSVMVSPYGIAGENLYGRAIVALTTLRVSLTLIIVLIGYLLWFVERQGPNRPWVRFYSSTSLPALGLIIISIISMFQAQDLQLSFFKIVQFIELFLMYFYLANHIRTKQDLQFFVTVLMGGMLAESLFMIVQWRTGWGFSFGGLYAAAGLSGSRIGGTLGSSNTAGVIISADLAIACAMLWLFPKKSQKIFAGICFVLGCIALISTAGRAAWGGFIVVILGFLLVGWRCGWVARRYLVWLFLVTLIIGGIFYSAISTRLTENDHGSAASRLTMFQLAWNMIDASPSNFFLGVGTNNYALVAPAYNTIVDSLFGRSILDTSVHNTFLLFWTETGLIGLIIFLSFLATPLVKAWRHIRSNDRFISLLSLSLGCAVLVMIIQMLVDPFIARPKMIFIWLLVSMIASLDNIEPTQEILYLGVESERK